MLSSKYSLIASNVGIIYPLLYPPKWYLPKWYPQKKESRVTTSDLIKQVHQEVIQETTSNFLPLAFSDLARA